MNSRILLFLLMPFLVIMMSCDRTVEDPVGDEMARLNAWLQVNNISTKPEASGLYYINQSEGTGIAPKDSNYVIISYTGKTLDDVVFDCTDKETAKLNDIFSYSTHYVPSYHQFAESNFSLKVIKEGIGKMKEGGKARLIIPSSIGFGSSSRTNVPAYSTLIYDIELNKVITDPVAYEQELLANYFSTHPGYKMLSDSVYTIQIDEGLRDVVVAKDSNVYVYYTGRFLDGFVFDTNVKSVALENNIYNSSKDYALLTFAIGSNSVVPGFELAVKHMKEGERIMVVIPSKYAYGKEGKPDGSPSIRPNTPLVFDIELKNVEPKIK